MENRRVLCCLLLIYFVLTFSCLFYWQNKNHNSLTGDEPHYLVLASAIAHWGTFEQSKAYLLEFKNNDFYNWNIREDFVSPQNTHALLGKNGLFNIHNVGLPLLLALPLKIKGVLGAQLTMLLLSAFLPFFVFLFACRFSKNQKNIFYSVLLSSIALPFIPASFRIFPDILAGILSLAALYGVFFYSSMNYLKKIILIFCIAFLPWLQIKFSAAAFILFFAFLFLEFLNYKKIKYFNPSNKIIVLLFLIIFSISFLLLAYYNFYAFDSVFGPYSNGALVLNKTNFMVLLGLFLDQNHGFLMQNPIHFVGVFYCAYLYYYNRFAFWVWLLVFLSFVIPHSMHPNWYGGASFVGRFQWAATCVFVIPTVLGLIHILEKINHQQIQNNLKLFCIKLFFCFSIALQLYFYHRYMRKLIHIFNKDENTPFDSYSVFYRHFLDHYLPMFYNSNLAFSYFPNYFWIGVFLIIFIFGFLNKERIKK